VTDAAFLAYDGIIEAQRKCHVKEIITPGTQNKETARGRAPRLTVAKDYMTS
jgi:hypothetical protein